MKMLPKIPPSSVRSGSTPPVAGMHSPERRLYFRTEARAINRTVTPISLFPHESEDARLTGETRSLFRRLLALNLPVVYEEHVILEKRIGKIA